jgi:2-keto-4-pentenoate hydratase/2-oxohepta-3-ene-1,7-dioic acid hydratase in catechol pathway
MRRRRVRAGLIVTTLLAAAFASIYCQRGATAGARQEAPAGVTKYVRFQLGDTVAYGIVEGDQVRQLEGDLFGEWSRTDQTHPLSSVKLLYPSARPSKVLAVAGNYRSHLDTDAEVAPYPEMFIKVPSALQHPEEDIVIPEMAPYCDYEGELVIVIGKRAKKVAKSEALDYVLGVTCGNDVSGIHYDDLLLTLRLNGEVKQQQRTSDMIHGVASIVSFVSQHMTLEPGDLIYTGTPGETSPIRPGDIVEVELEGVGVLRNGVRAEQ